LTIVQGKGHVDDGRRIGVIDDLKPAFPAPQLKGSCGLVFRQTVNELARRYRDIDLDADLRQLVDPAWREVKGLREPLVQSVVIQLGAANFNVPIFQLLRSPADHFIGAIGESGDISIGREGVPRKAFQNLDVAWFKAIRRVLGLSRSPAGCSFARVHAGASRRRRGS
jgi:hypothetical protein